MHRASMTSNGRSLFERCHVRVTYLMLMTSAASMMTCYGISATTYIPSGKEKSPALGPQADALTTGPPLNDEGKRPIIQLTHLYQVQKLKAQILRCLNLTAEPEPPTKKPPQPVHVLNRRPVPRNLTRSRPSTPGSIVWSEPVDMKKKMADRLLFRVSNPRTQSASINRVTLLLRLRSTQHSKQKLRKRDKPRRKHRQLPDIEGKGFQNDEQKQTSKKRSKSHGKKRGSKSRRRRSRRVKVLVQIMNNKSGKFKRVAVQRVVVDKKFRWIKLPIPASDVSRAAQSSNQSLVLRVRCKRCYKGGVSFDSAMPRKKSRLKGMEASSYLILNPNRPYLVISTANAVLSAHTTSSPSRVARAVDGQCPVLSDDTVSCCADRLHVTFRDLGWDHWIVQPEGFTTVVCRGICKRPAKLWTASSEQNSVSSTAHIESSSDRRLFPYDHKIWSWKRKVEEVIVNAAARAHGQRNPSESETTCQLQGLSPLAVTYYSDHNTLSHAVIPDLLANSCACGKM